jgi:hypothetical protein
MPILRESRRIEIRYAESSSDIARAYTDLALGRGFATARSITLDAAGKRGARYRV